MIGNLVALLTLLKGLPMTYNRDLQEDKERLFDTADTVRATVRLMRRRCLATPRSNRGRLRRRRQRSGAAGHRPGRLPGAQRRALPPGPPRRRRGWWPWPRAGQAAQPALTLAELQSADRTFGADALEVFDLNQALARRNLTGRPAPARFANNWSAGEACWLNRVAAADAWAPVRLRCA